YLKFQTDQTARIESLNKLLTAVDLLPTTRQRLELQVRAETDFKNEVENIASVFTALPPQQTVQNRIPGTQHFESYSKNIFRDWAWGAEENKVYAEFLNLITASEGEALLIGGGAGRLLYDFAHAKPNLHITQIDINPFLSQLAQLTCNGHPVELTELATSNFDLTRISKKYRLQVPPLKPERFQILVGDISNHPFADQTFSTVVCPWVIDILPEAFSDFSRRLNFLLKDQGELLIFGPLSFEKQSGRNRLSKQEVAETLQAAGFEVLYQSTCTVPYLQSPLEPQKRSEEIVCLRLRKIKTAKRPKDFQYFPNWLTNPTLKPTPQEAQVLMAVQAQKNIEAQFMAALLQGQSIADMAQTIS
ncbi:MAG: class I SAM-dependent methyltransferase, partial [Bdellovibrionaceae bacterium]|nr:class I SAM-dependent methyltransferase [Pseudobdellovibrionaceae bacterium]